MAELGAGDLVQTGFPLVEVQLMPYGAQELPLQTEIGLIMTKPFTGGFEFWASAVPHTTNAVTENNIVSAIEPQRMVCLPIVEMQKK